MDPPNAQTRLLQEPTFTQIEKLCRGAEHKMGHDDHRGAFDDFIAALEFLPGEAIEWNAAWILAALGENAVCAGSFEAALQPLLDAMQNIPACWREPPPGMKTLT